MSVASKRSPINRGIWDQDTPYAWGKEAQAGDWSWALHSQSAMASVHTPMQEKPASIWPLHLHFLPRCWVSPKISDSFFCLQCWLDLQIFSSQIQAAASPAQFME